MIVTVLAIAVPCRVKITSLEYAGKARRSASGRTMRRKAIMGLIPKALAASSSPLGTASMEPRKICHVGSRTDRE